MVEPCQCDRCKTRVRAALQVDCAFIFSMQHVYFTQTGMLCAAADGAAAEEREMGPGPV